MSLYVDKHRPKVSGTTPAHSCCSLVFLQSLGQLSFHPELTTRLSKMVAAGDFPHLLFYGPPGAGKKTRVSAVLREVYGAGVEKVKIEQRKVRRPLARENCGLTFFVHSSVCGGGQKQAH